MRYHLFLIILIVVFSSGCRKSDFTGPFSSGPKYYALKAHKGNASVKLDWHRAVACIGWAPCPPAFEAIRYQVLISEADTGNMREYRMLSASDGQITIDGLENGETYFFKIKAIDAKNRVEESSPVMVVPSLPLPMDEIPLDDHAFSAVVSPDGQYIAYTANYTWEEDGTSYGTMALYLRERNGEPHMVYMGVSTPSWSPVENKLVFTTSRGRSNIAPGYRPERIGIYDVETGEVEYIADGEYRNMYPVWSPDGQRIAVLADKDERNQYDLWELNLVYGEERMIGRMEYPGYEVGSPMSWSPDGQNIVFSAKNHDTETPVDYRIYTMDAQTGSRNQVNLKAWNTMSPSYSPDGKWLAFLSVSSGDAHVWAIERATGRIHQLTGEAPMHIWNLYQNRITWSPEGDKLYFMAYSDMSTQSSSLVEITLQGD